MHARVEADLSAIAAGEPTLSVMPCPGPEEGEAMSSSSGGDAAAVEEQAEAGEEEGASRSTDAEASAPGWPEESGAWRRDEGAAAGSRGGASAATERDDGAAAAADESGLESDGWLVKASRLEGHGQRPMRSRRARKNVEELPTDEDGPWLSGAFDALAGAPSLAGVLGGRVRRGVEGVRAVARCCARGLEHVCKDGAEMTVQVAEGGRVRLSRTRSGPCTSSDWTDALRVAARDEALVICY